MLRLSALIVPLVAFLTLVVHVQAQEILCPQHKHLEGEVQKCKSLLPDLSGKKDKLAAVSIRYGLRCAREVDPDISIPDIRERRCKTDDPQDFPRKFYQCWNRLLDTDELLTRVGFSGEDLEKFRSAAKCVNNVIEKTLDEQ
uniref:Putative secreted protein n=2 Tax=Amblyomma TaxID=6942 RepID=A0A023FR97_AMBCJ